MQTRPLFPPKNSTVTKSMKIKTVIFLGSILLIFMKGTWATNSSEKELSDLKALAAGNYGLPSAQYDLGCRYKEGNGVPKSEGKAYVLFIRSATQGDGKAAYKLSMALYNGEGVFKDKIEGLAWMNVAVDRGLPSGARETMKKSLSTQEIQKEELRTHEIQRIIGSTEAGYKPENVSQNQLAFNLMTDHPPRMDDFLKAEIDRFEADPSVEGIDEYFGDGSLVVAQASFIGNGSTNPVTALKGFLQKANGGDKWSEWLIGDLYYKNTKAPYFNEALRWFRKAAEHGDAKYQYQLGSLLERTHPQEAIEWYKKSAKQDYGDAQYALGYHYLYSEGGDKDPSTACDYFLKSAKHGDPTAMSIVSQLYYTGDGVSKDQLEGLAWMYLAAGSGTGWPLYRQWQEYVAQWEKQGGGDFSLKAQQRAKELKKDIKVHSGL